MINRRGFIASIGAAFGAAVVSSCGGEEEKEVLEQEVKHHNTGSRGKHHHEYHNYHDVSSSYSCSLGYHYGNCYNGLSANTCSFLSPQSSYYGYWRK